MIAGQEVIFEPPAFEKCICLGINIIIIIIIIFILRIIIIFLWHMRNEHLHVLCICKQEAFFDPLPPGMRGLVGWFWRDWKIFLPFFYSKKVKKRHFYPRNG